MAEDVVKARQDGFDSSLLDQNKGSVIFLRAQLRRKVRHAHTAQAVKSSRKKKGSVRPGHRAGQHCGGWRVQHPVGCETHDSEPPGLGSQWRVASAP